MLSSFGGACNQASTVRPFLRMSLIGGVDQEEVHAREHTRLMLLSVIEEDWGRDVLKVVEGCARSI